MPVERTLAIVKPGYDFADRLIAVMAAIKQAGLTVIVAANRELTFPEVVDFYAEHKKKSFFTELVDYMLSGACYLVVLEGEDAVATWRALMGATDPKKAEPGTLRADLGKSVQENGFHGSDSRESAEREIGIAFPKLPKPQYT